MRLLRAFAVFAIVALAAAIRVGAADKPHASIAPPDPPGVRKPTDPGVKFPQDPGMTVAPPIVDSKAVKTPPKNIDPKIDEASDAIERKNRKKSNARQAADKDGKQKQQSRD